MGLRLVPRTIEAIKAAGRLAKYHAIDKHRLAREAAAEEARLQQEQARRAEAERQRREEEVAHEERRAYAREKGERQAILDMTEEARRKELDFQSKMVTVRERAEEVARQGAERRKSERDEWVNAIANVADRFGG